jgi:hypothetical protein
MPEVAEEDEAEDVAVEMAEVVAIPITAVCLTSLGTRSFSAQEWQNMTSAQRQEVYRQRDRLAMARTVAAVINESLGSAAQGQGDDISAIISPMTGNNAGIANSQNERNSQGREDICVNLENISQLITRRQNTSAFATTSRKSNTRVNISQVQQLTDLFWESRVRFTYRYM